MKHLHLAREWVLTGRCRREIDSDLLEGRQPDAQPEIGEDDPLRAWRGFVAEEDEPRRPPGRDVHFIGLVALVDADPPGDRRGIAIAGEAAERERPPGRGNRGEPCNGQYRCDCPLAHPISPSGITVVPSREGPMNARVRSREGARQLLGRQCDGGPGISSGWLVPWMPITPPPGHSLSRE